ncbi:MAG: DUF4382 domain-containing protein [Armatimonadetes bacterium]|nr:DUF4382 domain-containing protein [Armatimonadota bacterium]
MKKLVLLLSFVCLALAFLIGCGGGSSDMGSGVQSGPVALYATDSMGSYSHVWVKIYGVDLHGAGGSQTLFSDPSGQAIDLTTLRDAQGAKFQFLGQANVAGGPFSSMSVKLDKNLTVFAKGSQSGVDKQFGDSFDLAGKSVVTVQFQRPMPFGLADKDLAVDFDLAHWTENGSKVTPVIALGNEAGLADSGRQVPSTYRGIVTNLTGTKPNQQFDLALLAGGQFHVKTSSVTFIFFAGPPSGIGPDLANGELVDVQGIFTSTTPEGFMGATSIGIHAE